MEPRVVDDADRYPALSEAGRDIMRFMREHACAPRFNNQSGHRLSPEEARAVRAFMDRALTEPVGWRPGIAPAWLGDYIAQCFETVPFYRAYGRRPARLVDIPTTTRADLSRDIAAFVPDTLPVEGMIHFSTSGTSGHPLLLASHPTVAGSYVAFIRRACAELGITLTHGRGQVGVALIGHQRKCFTYVSYTPTMDDSGLVKLNLHPIDWRSPDDRAPYLDALNAEVYTGDPISFSELLRLDTQARPKVMISTSMQLMPALRAQLEARFGCPVLDFYSMNESGPVAYAATAEGPHRCLQARMFIEVLDGQGNTCPPGVRGEVTLTGGYNPYLPLLRYRTGDQAALVFEGERPALVGLSGRPPTVYRAADGAFVNNVDVTHALKPFVLSQWQLHQRADRAVHLRVRDDVTVQPLREALAALFGDVAITVEAGVVFDDKVIQYTSELA